MLIYLVIGLVLAAVVFLLPSLMPQNRRQVKELRFWALMILAVAVAAVLVVRGNYIGAVIPVILPLFRDFLVKKVSKTKQQRGGDSPKSESTGEMSRREALEVLDLEDPVTDDAVEAAYKRLMAANHPDKGGSNWIAERLNTARRVLLGK